MAGGLGTRLFVQGDVISAADVNGYLMNQSMMRFATTAARDTAFGNGIAVGVTVGGVAGDGKPLLQEGMFAYIDLNNDVQYFNGSTWVSAPQFVLADGEVTTAKLADDAVTSAKIADGAITAAHIADGTIIAADIADGSVTSAKILDGTIVNADINAAAGIAASKISGTAITAADTGTVTSTMIADDSIVNGDINASAAIAYSKLNLGTSIVNADVSASAAIAYSKLSLSGAITTTDLAAGAARSGFRSHIVAQQGATHTIAASDVGGLVVLSSCTSVVIPTSDGTFTVGDRIDFLQTGSQVVTFSATAPQIVGGFDAQTKLGGQYAVATLVKYAANTWVLVGNITS